jgi:hypothetical protein
MLEDLTNFGDRQRSGWDRLARVDWPIARAMALSGDRRAPVVVAKALSRLGNGPIYFVMLVALVYFQPQGAMAVALSGAASILLLHCVYPTISASPAQARRRRSTVIPSPVGTS